MKRALITAAMVTLAACGIKHQQGSPEPATIPVAAAAPVGMSSHGVAGWVGQEFAGRTTANGEIFDPMLMTAAHRTLPFGTLLDVHNPKTNQTVRVRVNDRGPYVGDRLIDLSYAAAQEIGLADGAGGEVDVNVVKIGRGDREPPAAFAVNVPENTSVAAVAPAPSTVPAPVPAPSEPQLMPAPVSVEPQSVPAPATVESVQVTEQHSSGIETRKEVAANGTSIVEVPVTSTPIPVPAPAPTTPARQYTPGPATPRSQTAAPRTGRYTVQVGAFSQEANAKALQKKLKAIGQEATIDHTTLYLVRIGPFDSREQAVSVRAKLEAAGISAIITSK